MRSFSALAILRAFLFALLTVCICSNQPKSLVASAEETQVGAGWRALGPFGGNVTKLAIHPTNPAIVYAIAGDQFPRGFRSESGGASWAPLSPSSGNVVFDVVFDPANGNTVYLAGSSGIQKSTNGAPFITIFNQAGEIALSAANPNLIYVLANAALNRSMDGGANFTALPLPAGVFAGKLTASPSNANTLYLGAFQEILRSTDGGQSWTRIPFDTPTSFAIHPTNANIVYVSVAHSSVFKTTDGGNNWNEVRTGLPNGNTLKLALSLSSPETLYLGTGPTPDTMVGGGVYKTTNGGASWSRTGQTSLPEDVAFTALAVHPANANQVLAGSQAIPDTALTRAGNLYKTSDGGANWSISNNGLNAIAASVLAFNASLPNVIYAGANRGTEGQYKSADGGASWNSVNDSIPYYHRSFIALSIHPTNPNTVYASSGNTFFRTLNGGANWLAPGEFSGAARVIEISRSNPNVVYLGGIFNGTTANPSGLYRTLDGGASWRPVPGPGNVFATAATVTPALHPSDANIVLVNANGVLYKSMDGGNTWATLANVAFDRIYFSPSNPSQLLAIAANRNTTYRSLDGGATWSLSTHGFVNNTLRALAINPLNANVAYAAASNLGVLRTNDGGVTWQSYNAGLDQITILDLGIDATGNLLRVAGNNGVYELRLPTVCAPPFGIGIVPGQPRRCEGTAWTMSATVGEGTPPFTYVWRKDGVIIPGATGISISGNGTEAEAGFYTVIVSNACGSAISPTPGPGSLTIEVLTSVFPATASFSALGGRGSFTPDDFNSQDDLPCSRLSASSDTSWLRVDSETRPGGYTYVVDPNPGAAPRTGTFTVRSAAGRTATHTVTQAGSVTDGSDVVWTNLNNTLVSGVNLRKTAGFNDGTWDGSATSQQSIAGGNGYFEFIASGPNVYRAAGLNGAGGLSNENSLDHAVVFTNSNIVELRESGQYRGDTTFATGDVFRIAIEGGRAAFFKNGVLLARGSLAPTYPLRAAAVFSNLNGEISSAKLIGSSAGGCTYSITPTSESISSSSFNGITSVSAQAGCAWTAVSNASWLSIGVGTSGTGNGTVAYTALANTGPARTGTLTIAGQTLTVLQAATNTGGNAITWINFVNTTLSGNILRKTAGYNDGTWDGRALSQQSITAGEAYLEFKATGPQLYRAIGLNTGTDIGNEASIDFAVVFTNSSIAEFRQSGAYLGETRYAAGDTFRVAIEGTRARFYHNDVASALSTVAPLYPLRVAAAFSSYNGEISAATLTTGRPAAAAAAARRGPLPSTGGTVAAAAELSLPRRSRKREK